MSDQDQVTSALSGAKPVEARSSDGSGNNAANAQFGAVGQVFTRVAENSYADGKELMERAAPLEWAPAGTVIDAALGRPVFVNNPNDEVPQGRAGGNTTIGLDGGPLQLGQPGVFQNPDGSLFRIPLTDDLRFVNQPTGDLPQGRDISVAVFDQDLNGDGVDEDLPTPFGTNDFHLFFGQALTHDMVETQVNVTAISIPGSTGIGWAGGRVDANGNPTAAILVRVNPQTGQALTDAQGRPLAPLTQAQIDALKSGTAELPAITLANGSVIPAVSAANQQAAWSAIVNHQALSEGAPFALQRTPGVYDDNGVRQQANTETAFLDLGNVYGKQTTAVVQKNAIGNSTFVDVVEGSEVTDAAGVTFVTIRVDTTNLLRKLDANGQPTAFMLTSDDVASPRSGDNLLPTYREVNANQNVFVDLAGTTANEAELAMGAVFDPTLANFFDLDRFAAGDQRVNQNIATVTQQTIWMRNHNEWAEKIAAEHPDWTADQVFDLARAINEAEYQKAVYDEYLPALLGQAGMDMIGDYTGYKPDVNPAVINEWTTIAFRFGHDQSSNVVESLLEDGSLAERVALIESFTRAGAGADASVPDSAVLDAWMRGQLATAHQAIDGYTVRGNRGELFGVTVSPVTGQPVINDLTVFDVVRGRDHGVNSYVKLREALGLSTYTQNGTGVEAFQAWAADNGVSQQRLDALIELYGGDFLKLDAYVGVLLEEKFGDSQLGVTSTMLVAMQFAATRDGDRLWYENRFKDQPEILALIEDSSMADVIARTTGVEHVYRDAFLEHDRIGGTDGRNTLNGDDGRDLVIGFGGDDRLNGNGGNDDLHGGAGNDRLDGGKGDDRLFGNDGSDTGRGGAGNDRLDGGAGRDDLRGDDGADRLLGGAGNDELRGDDGADVLNGGSGRDRIEGGAGNDVVLAGHDGGSYNGGRGMDELRIEGGGRVDLGRGQMTSADGKTTSRVAEVENVTVTGDVATGIIGSSVNNVIRGGGGNDGIRTGNGVDTVWLGEGHDTVFDFDLVNRSGEATFDRARHEGPSGTIDIDSEADVFALFFKANDGLDVDLVADGKDARVIRDVKIVADDFSATLRMETSELTFNDGRTFADQNGFDRSLIG